VRAPHGAPLPGDGSAPPFFLSNDTFFDITAKINTFFSGRCLLPSDTT